MTVSPLLLHHADQVAFLQDGTVADVGTHDELLARNAGYRHVVVRALDDPDSPDTDTATNTTRHREAPLMTELATRLPGSAETWRDAPAGPRVPDSLLPPTGGPVGDRLRAWRGRHLERRAAGPGHVRVVPAPRARTAGGEHARRHRRSSKDLLVDRRWMVALLLAPARPGRGRRADRAAHPRCPGRRRGGARDPVARLDSLGLAVGRRRGAAGGPHVRGAARVDDPRPGRAGRRPRAHRADGAAAAAGPGGERELRRPGHPGDPRRLDDERERAVRRCRRW